MEKKVVLPVELDQPALEKAPLRLEGMEAVHRVIMVTAGADDGQRQLLLPAVLEEEATELAAQKE
jgi:hypothetical protein